MDKSRGRECSARSQERVTCAGGCDVEVACGESPGESHTTNLPQAPDSQTIITASQNIYGGFK